MDTFSVNLHDFDVASKFRFRNKIDIKRTNNHSKFLHMVADINTYNDLSLIENIIIKEGISLACSKYKKQNFIHYFARSKGNSLNIFKFLIANNVIYDLDDRNNVGSTALHIACGYNFVPMVQLLLDYGANINIVNDEKHSCLYYAARNDAFDCVHLIITSNQQLINHEQAFNIAAEYKSINCIKIFNAHNYSYLSRMDNMNVIECALFKHMTDDYIMDNLDAICPICNIKRKTPIDIELHKKSIDRCHVFMYHIYVEADKYIKDRMEIFNNLENKLKHVQRKLQIINNEYKK